MKIKVKVFALASDTRHEGTSVYMCGSQAEMDELKKDIIQEDISGDVTEKADEIRALIDGGEIDEAFSEWEEHIRPESDTYCEDEQEIEVELPQVDAALSLLETIAQYFDDSEMTILSRSIDESAFVEVLKNTIKSLSPAPTVSA